MKVRRSRACAGQATVETALVLPVVAVLLLAVVQAGLLARDQVTAVHAARAAARAVAVQPDQAAADRVLADLGLDGRSTVRLSGGRAPGDLVTVTVTLRPVLVPVIGAPLASVRITERLTALVEGL